MRQAEAAETFGVAENGNLEAGDIAEQDALVDVFFCGGGIGADVLDAGGV